VLRKNRILIISSLPTGMKSFFLDGKKYIEGMPAYAKCIFGLLKNGYEIHLICLSDQQLNPPRIENLYIYRVNMQPYTGSRFNVFRRIIPFAKVLYMGIKLNHKINFGILYGHFDLGCIVGILSILIKVPNIRRIYGTFLYPLLKNQTKWKRVKAFIKLPLDYLAFTLPTSALIITNDGTHGDKVAEILGQKPSKVHFLYNGIEKNIKEKLDIESARHTLKRMKEDEQQNVIVYLSRLADWKRVDRAILALKHISYKPRPLLVIIGDGPCRDELENLATQIGVDSQVRFLGQLPHEEALSIISVSDISLSLYDVANLGNVLIESMILGKCIISLDDGSLDGVVENDFNGILLDEPAPELMAQAIDDILINQDKRLRYGKNAMERASEIFDSWDERIQKEIGIIEKIMSLRQ
jgi:glycosyltransferase involved in cell wall biosynthesis